MEKTVCITGADYGLGFSLVKRFLEAGWKVFAGQYQKERRGLDELAVLFPGRLFVTELDVADDASVKKAAVFIARHTSVLDVLINNAAILGDTEAGLFDDIDFTEILAVFNVNAVGALRVTHSLAQLLMQSEEKLLVNISSEAGSIGKCYRQSWFGYSMAKAALNMQSCLIHNTIQAQGGRVLVLHPGWMQTYMRGYKDETARYTPDQSAARLYEIIINYKPDNTKQTAFLDVECGVYPW